MLGCGYSLVTGNPCLLWQQSSIVSSNSDICQMSRNRTDVTEPFLKPKRILSVEWYTRAVEGKHADALCRDFKAVMSGMSEKKGSHRELDSPLQSQVLYHFHKCTSVVVPPCVSPHRGMNTMATCAVSSSEFPKAQSSSCPALAFTRSCKLSWRTGPAWAQHNQLQMCETAKPSPVLKKIYYHSKAIQKK